MRVDAWGRRRENRKILRGGTLNRLRPSRLSYVTFVYGDVEVRVRPDRDGGFFGSATSGSAW